LTPEQKRKLKAELTRIAEATRAFKYNPVRFLSGFTGLKQ
jgi:hypothetical protein